MKKQLLTIIALIFSSGTFAEGIYNNGANITIGNGVTIYVNGNYQNETNVSGGTLDLSGTLKLSGNFTNNVTNADAIGDAATGGKVELIGNTTQTIGGTTNATITFPDITINNSSGVTVAKNVRVTGALSFTSGLIDIGSNNLTFGTNATVAGTPSSLSMILATGTGEVRKEYSGNGLFTFPVGENTVTPEYSPVTLNFVSGTFNSGAYAGVNLKNEAYPDPYISGSYLTRYWNVTQAGITSFTCDAAFDYQIADVVGTESYIYGARINPAPVSLFGPVNSALHQLTATGLTSFGTFTGAIGQRTLNLTVFLEGLYNGGGAMRQAFDETGLPHWPAGVADHIAVELHDAITYTTILHSILDVPLSTTGTASLTIPATFNASYYITVKHRNSIETTTATAISFAGSIVNQSFATLADVYRGNLGLSADGSYLIYSGDVNQDGIVDTGDMNGVDNGSTAILVGYNTTDINGDGIVDTGDMNIVDNNSTAIVVAKLP